MTVLHLLGQVPKAASSTEPQRSQAASATHFSHPQGAETERALTPLEIRLLEKKRFYKVRITKKKKGKAMDRDGNKTNQDLKNKSVLNRHKIKPLGNQPYFCVTAEPSIGNIVSLVFKQILRKEEQESSLQNEEAF